MTKLLRVTLKMRNNIERRYIVIVDLFRWYPSGNWMGGSRTKTP
jgi:hypothetical protein